jgi:hypothetical protein
MERVIGEGGILIKRHAQGLNGHASDVPKDISQGRVKFGFGPAARNHLDYVNTMHALGACNPRV